MIYEHKKTYPQSKLNESPMRATMFLNGTIGDGSTDEFGKQTLDSYAFASEMINLKNAGYDITVDINSIGGSVVHGLSIFDAVVRTKSDTRVVGLAASMAAAISQAGNKRYINDIGALMFHGITQNSTPDQYMDILNQQLRGILQSRSKLDKEAIDQIFDNNVDTFFAIVGVPENRHAEKMGLVDEVVATGLNMPNERLESVMNHDNLVSAYNILLGDSKKENEEMESLKTIKSHLGLDAEASEKSMIDAINALKNSANSLAKTKKANEVLTAENTALKNERIDGLVDSAKENGYPSDQIDALKSFATNDFKGASNLVSTFSATPSQQGVTSSVTSAMNVTPSDKPEEKTLLSYNDYMSTAENEALFFQLTKEEQNQVIDAHQKTNNINIA